MTEAFVGLGGNLGDRLGNLAEALRCLTEDAGVHVARVSRVYETEPVGGPEQPPFANAVALVRTSMGADRLLEWLLAIEDAMGRDRSAGPDGPRVIDLDLLLFGDEEWAPRDAFGLADRTRLTLPHPRMLEREFVMRPLLEIAPDARMPDGRPLRDLAAGATLGRVLGELGHVPGFEPAEEPAPEPQALPRALETAEQAVFDAADIDEQPNVWWDPDEEWVPIGESLRMAAGRTALMRAQVQTLHDAGIPAALDPATVGHVGAVGYIVDAVQRLLVPASFVARAREVLEPETASATDIAEAEEMERLFEQAAVELEELTEGGAEDADPEETDEPETDEPETGDPETDPETENDPDDAGPFWERG